MKIPTDPANASGCPACANSSGCADCAGFVNATCGGAQLVCTSGGGFSLFTPHFKDPAQGSAYPYGPMAMGYGVPSHVSSFSAEQLPVKKAVVDHFSVFNRYFTSTPTASTPNHLFAQSATSCGIKDNIMYSECGGPTDTFPQLTIYDSLFLHNVSFSLFMNSTCGQGLNGSGPCHSVSPHTADAGSPVPVPDVAMVGVGRYKKHFVSQHVFYERAANGTLPAVSWLMPPLQACEWLCCCCCCCCC
jgi:phospholipase C